MFVAVSRLVLHIPGARTLKDRRQVIRSFKDRVRARFPVSIAEVGDSERLQVASFGVAVVSSDRSRCQELSDAVRSLAGNLPEAILADARSEVLSFGQGGEGLGGGIEHALDPRRQR